MRPLTGIADGRVQQVHGRPAQPQAAHAVRGLLEVGHHARTRLGTGTPAAGQTLDGPGGGGLESPCTEREGRAVEQIQAGRYTKEARPRGAHTEPRPTGPGRPAPRWRNEAVCSPHRTVF